MIKNNKTFIKIIKISSNNIKTLIIFTSFLLHHSKKYNKYNESEKVSFCLARKMSILIGIHKIRSDET